MKKTFACIASGPSLKKADIDYCISKGWGIAACNDAAFQCDKLDVFMAFDANWWATHGHRVADKGADLWTINPIIAKRFNAREYQYKLGGGYSTEQGMVYWGELTGYQLLQAVSWYGAKRVIMLGYDMQHTDDKAHYNGDHPEGWNNAQDLDRKMRYWPALAYHANHSGIEIINCSRQTAITCIKRQRLEDVT